MKLRTELLRIQEVMNVKKTLITEEVIDGKIICDNCGWEWKMSEGGNDLYICHKCDHDNTPQWIEKLNPIPPHKKKIVFKFFDKKGVRYSKNIVDFAKLDDSKFFLLMYEYLGGVEKFSELLQKKFLGKKYTCNECGYGKYNFTYKIWSINASWEGDYLGHYIEVDVDVLHLTRIDSNGQETQLTEFESEHWDEVEDIIRENIKDQLDGNIFYDLYGMETQVGISFT
jgi:hypothetical protein